MAAHVDINLIVIGQDLFPPDKLAQLDASIEGMKAIFAARGPVIGTVNRFPVTSADAGPLILIQSKSEGRALASKWAVPNDAIDMFVVQKIAVNDPKNLADGWSPVGGSCNKKKTKGFRTPVVSLNGGAPNSSNTFAHELGHFLGLEHCEVDPPSCAGDPANFIKSKSNANTGVTFAQSEKMKTHCSVKP